MTTPDFKPFQPRTLVGRTTLLNLTPHPVTIAVGDGRLLTLLPTADMLAPQVEMCETIVGGIDGIMVKNFGPGRIKHLPPHRKGTFYIVRRVVAKAASLMDDEFEDDRSDLVYPADLEHDRSGRVVACRSLGSFHWSL